jgi:glycosyltransferase involved in cell wall biosynthesis
MIPRHVLLLNRWFHPEVFGGTESSLWGLGRAMQELGFKTTVVCEGRAAPLGWQDVDGFRVYRHDSAPPPTGHWSLRNLGVHRHIVHWLRRLAPELTGLPIVCRTHWYAAAARTVFPRARVIFWCPGTGRLFEATERDSLTGRARHWATFEMLQSRLVERRAVRGVNYVVAESGHVARDLMRHYHVPRRKVRVWRNGVETERFRPRPPDAALLQELGLPPDCPLIVTAARFAPMKNLGFLIRAIAGMQQRQTRLVLLGDGSEKANLEQLARALNIAERVFFPGFRPDVERFFSLATAFVLPSTYEPYGNAFTEALASGVPTLGLRPQPGILVPSDEHIVDGENGFLLEPNNEQELTSKLDRLVTDRALRDRLARNARTLALERYDWNRTARQFLEALGTPLTSGEPCLP